MLIDISTGKEITDVPYRSEFDTLCQRLSQEEFEKIVARINELIDDSGGEIVTAGWLPGNDWTHRPFEPIYLKAARMNHDLAARFFGLLVWYTVMHRPERWASGRYELDGEEIRSRTYFQLRR